MEKNLSESVENEDSGKIKRKVMSGTLLPDYYFRQRTDALPGVTAVEGSRSHVVTTLRISVGSSSCDYI